MSKMKDMEERKKQLIHCTLFVLVLLFLAFGDQIALRYIKSKPNPNNKVFGNVEKEEFTIDFLTSISVEEILDKIEKKENFLLLSSQDNCIICDEYYKNLSNSLIEEEKGYFLNIETIDWKEENVKKFQEMNTNIKDHIKYTPYLMYFENGNLKSELVGKKERQEIENFIKNRKKENI